MGATEEQMSLLNGLGVMHVSYVLILYSFAFMLFLCKFAHIQLAITILIGCLVVNVLLHIYAVHAWPNGPEEENEGQGKYASVNGTHSHVRSRSEAQRIQDAEGFELEGLISDEEGESSMGPKKSLDEEMGRKEAH